jgi:hypothetical protein
MKLSFIEELTESRMFRHQRDFSSYNNRELAELAMISLLVIYVNQDQLDIRKYLDETLGMGDFDRIRSSATDLANVISVLKNFETYKIEIRNSNISFPVLQFKNFARQIISRQLDKDQGRRLIFVFEDFLKISSGEMRSMRRTALEYSQSSPSDRTRFRKFINDFFNNRARQMDLAVWFRSNP